MAHFALLDNNNVVLNVIYVENRFMLDDDGNESEAMGVAQCRKGLNDPNARLVRTSYNSSIRCRYAGIGYTYDEENDVFLTPKTYPSWILDETTYVWEPPTPKPQLTEEQIGHGSSYDWNEETRSWDFNDRTPPPEEGSTPE